MAGSSSASRASRTTRSSTSSRSTIPTVYTSVYRGQTSLTKLKDRVYEYACHEGNYGLQNILEGGRRNDRLGIVNKTDGEQRGE